MALRSAISTQSNGVNVAHRNCRWILHRSTLNSKSLEICLCECWRNETNTHMNTNSIKRYIMELCCTKIREQRHNKLSIYRFKHAVHINIERLPREPNKYLHILLQKINSFCVHAHHSEMSHCVCRVFFRQLLAGLRSVFSPKQSTQSNEEWTRKTQREWKE